MKKLMIAAAAAAMTAGAFAACSDIANGCVAWDLSLKAKTLAPKKISCKDVCGDKSTLYYLDAASRTLKGYLWICEYECESSDAFNVVLWDAKAKLAIVACPPCGLGDYQTADLTMADLMVYGKKANKVAAAFQIAGVNAAGEDAIDVTLAGVNGSINKTTCGDCFVKNLSGYFAGSILPVIPGLTQQIGSYSSGLCGDIVIPDCEDDEIYPVYYTTLCEVCGGFDGWCKAEECAIELDDMVPAVGSWSMKYNKKLGNTKKTMCEIVPAYAL